MAVKVTFWPDPSSPATTEERVFAALDDLACDPEASTELIGLAAGVGSRRVKAILAEKETTFTAELLARRMARARQLLTETGFAIANVAKLCGYRCQSTFAKRFASQHHGIKPRQFRVAHGGTARVGGTTGAFRKPAQRARAQQEGSPAPGMRRARSLAGTMQAYWAEHENERRRALLRGDEPPRRAQRAYQPYDYSDAEIAEYLAGIEDDWFADDPFPDE